MKMFVRPQFVFLLALVMILSMACSGQSIIPSIPAFPSIATPSMNNVPTGSSPMSGDWNVNADFGRFAFTVDPDGKNITTAVFELSNWTCGGTTLSTSVQSLSQWPISNGQFAGFLNLNGNFHTMSVEGTYDDTNKQFTGTWEEDAHGTVCSGTWEAIPRK